MDGRALALARMTLGVVALAACFSPAGGWSLVAAVVGGLGSLALIAGFHPRLAALITAGALALAAPAHALLRLLLLLLAATDCGARASVDAVMHPSRARARVPSAPIAVMVTGAAIGVGLAAGRHQAGAIEVAAVVAVILSLTGRRLLDRLSRLVADRTSTIDVIYDGKCSFCRRSMDTLLAMDSLERIRPRDAHDPATQAAHPTLDAERTQREMVVFDGRRLEGGFDAFRLMAWKLPAVWLLVPLLYLPPVPQIGRIVYRYIAANRLKIACELNVTPPKRATPDPAPRTLSPAAGAALLVAAAGLETLLALGWL